MNPNEYIYTRQSKLELLALVDNHLRELHVTGGEAAQLVAAQDASMLLRRIIEAEPRPTRWGIEPDTADPAGEFRVVDLHNDFYVVCIAKDRMTAEVIADGLEQREGRVALDQ
jgi:hypothetical protein